MFERTELEHWTVKELRELAKKLNISGRWDMNKQSLINSIMESQANSNIVEDSSEHVNNNHDTYLKNIEIGRLVAFRDTEKGIVRTAKVVRISQARRKLRVKDIYNQVEDIDFDNIAWVKTGKRWPKKLFSLIKYGQAMQNALRSW